MEKISRPTFFLKRVFPALWLGGVGVGAVVAATAFFSGKDAGGHPLPIMVLVVPLLMLVFGFTLFRKLIWDLADEVEDFGDYLRVRRGGIDERVNLADVMNVNMSQFTNPPRLTLRLRKPGAFGDEIVFIPQTPGVRLNPFARNPIAERLIQRIDRLRANGTSR